MFLGCAQVQISDLDVPNTHVSYREYCLKVNWSANAIDDYFFIELTNFYHGD
jgi:hypothetical protein